MPAPLVSVLMAVHNGGSVVRRSIGSILGQDFRNFEFLIVDDGSTDETPSALRSIDDPRLRILTVSHRGLAAALNHGLGRARGRFVARQDDDDFSLPDRLDRQVRYLTERPGVVLVGSAFEFTSPAGERIRVGHPPDSDLRISWTLLFRNVFAHGCAMFSRKAALSIGGYADLPRSQDYDLWSRLSRAGVVGTVPETLYRWTQDPGGLSGGAGKVLQDRIAAEIALRNVRRTLGEAISDPLGEAVRVLGNGREWEVAPDLAVPAVLSLYRLKREILSWRGFPPEDRAWLDAQVRRRAAKLGVRRGLSAVLAGVRAIGEDPFVTGQILRQAARRIIPARIDATTAPEEMRGGDGACEGGT